MTDRAELRKTRPRELVALALIQPRGGIVDEHAQLQFAQPALARPLMRDVEQIRAGAEPPMPFGNLHVADMQRVAFLA